MIGWNAQDITLPGRPNPWYMVDDAETGEGHWVNTGYHYESGDLVPNEPIRTDADVRGDSIVATFRAELNRLTAAGYGTTFESVQKAYDNAIDLATQWNHTKVEVNRGTYEESNRRVAVRFDYDLESSLTSDINRWVDVVKMVLNGIAPGADLDTDSISSMISGLSGSTWLYIGLGILAVVLIRK